MIKPIIQLINTITIFLCTNVTYSSFFNLNFPANLSKKILYTPGSLTNLYFVLSLLCTRCLAPLPSLFNSFYYFFDGWRDYYYVYYFMVITHKPIILFLLGAYYKTLIMKEMGDVKMTCLILLPLVRILYINLRVIHVTHTHTNHISVSQHGFWGR